MYGTLNFNSITTEKLPGRADLDRKAALLFSIEQGKSQFRRFTARFSKRNMRMLDLNKIRLQDSDSGRSFLGNKSVQIDLIQGSESRCDDFDIDVRPQHDHNRQRWINIAIARLSRVTLPPVELIQAGGFYFIRDGHHRTSVARALGEKYIDAIIVSG